MCFRTCNPLTVRGGEVGCGESWVRKHHKVRTSKTQRDRERKGESEKEGIWISCFFARLKEWSS